MRTRPSTIDELMTPCTLLLEDAKVVHPLMVWTDTPVGEVLGEMLSRRIGSALVVDQRSLERGRVVGIFTAVDAVKALEQVTREGACRAATSCVLPAARRCDRRYPRPAQAGVPRGGET